MKFQNLQPWSDRDTLVRSGMTQFGPDKEDGFVVMVTPQAVRDLREGTSRYAPKEAFGILMGRAFEDGKGVFTVVDGAVYANHLKASTGHVKLTAEEMGLLRQEARRRYPIADYIGWTHSHSFVSQYSPTDKEEQSTWTEGHNVGILTFMGGSAWAVAYRGPNSRYLPPSVAEKSSLFKGLGQQAPLPPPNQQRPNDPNKEKQPPSGKLSQPNHALPQEEDAQPLYSHIKYAARWGIPFIVLFWLLVLTALLVMNFLPTLATLSKSVAVLRTDMNHLTSAKVSSTVITPAAQLNLTWDCNVKNGPAPLKVKCTGPTDPSIQTWYWDFGDGALYDSHSNTATHTYNNPGTYIITLTVRYTVGVQDASTLDVTANAPAKNN
jgi:hypothetical protein